MVVYPYMSHSSSGIWCILSVIVLVSNGGGWGGGGGANLSANCCNLSGTWTRVK